MICTRCQAELDPAIGRCRECGAEPGNVLNWREQVRDSVRRRRERRASELNRREEEGRQLSIFPEDASTLPDSPEPDDHARARERHREIKARVEHKLTQPRRRRSGSLVDAGEVAIGARAVATASAAPLDALEEEPSAHLPLGVETASYPDDFELAEAPGARTEPARENPRRLENLASPTERLLAGVIDLAFLAILLLGLTYVTTNMIGRPLRGLPASSLAALGCVEFFIAAGYFVLFWGLSGQTLGSLIARNRVVNRLGRPPGLASAVLRLVGLALALVPAGLGLVGIFTDRERRGWHDRLAATRVVSN